MNRPSKLPNVGTTIFTKMSNLAKEYNAINLSQGFPDFKTDPKLSELVTEAMQRGENQYAPMLGIPELREAISEKFNKIYNTTYDPNKEIVVTAGATQAIASIIAAFIQQDDEVILFRPAYDSYEPSIELNGGKVVSVQLQHPNYSVDWNEVRSKVNDRTRMIVVNTPQNPSGTIFTKEDMQQLEAITENTGIIVLSDEVYEHMVYDGETHQSACLFPGLKKRTFITASFGKTFHNTGWKTGYCCGPQALMEEFVKVHQFQVYCVNRPMQTAIAQYMKDENHYVQLPSFFQKKRDLFLEAIENSRFQFIPCQATYFQLLSYNDISDEYDVTFAERLTKENGIASIPMSVFNENQLDFKVLRFCFAKTEETLLRAAEILNKI